MKIESKLFIPFEKHTRYLVHIPYKTDDPTIEWIENYEFFDMMDLHRFYKGRSSAGVIWKSRSDDREYHMFISDLVKTAHLTSIRKGMISGNFTFRKSGTAYGLIFLGETRDKT